MVHIVTTEGLKDISARDENGNYLDWRKQFPLVCENVKEALERNDQ